MEEKTNIRFRLVSIDNEVLNQNFGSGSIADINEQELKFQYKIGTVIKMSEDLIVVVPSIRYMYNNNVIFESSAEFVYSVQNLTAAIDVDKENKKINVKSNIFPSLLGGAYSTLRGMAFIRAKETPLALFPAPMVEVDTLLNRNGISVVD